jgi:serine/threonine protein kinase
LKSLTVSAGTQVAGENGHYTIGREISSGGMAILYAGKKKDTGEKVVIKTPKRAGDGYDDVRVDKLKVEAKILKSLNHKNIVRYIDEREEKDNFYLVIEMIEGHNLKEEYLGKPQDDRTVREYMSTMLYALDYLHNRSPPIIHRDINPKNIMRDQDRKVVLIDFGTAKQGYVQVTAQPTQIGTPGWSAPEQFTTGQVTPCSDIYALGAVMFFLLTGQEPRMHMQAGGGLARLPRQINRSVSEELSSIVGRAMNTDPTKRFQTAHDMISMLTKGRETKFGSPHIIFGGTKYPLNHGIEIGRLHTCGADCKAGHWTKPSDICVDDRGSFISKHHARISVNGSGKYYIEDLKSTNRTAISNDGGVHFRLLRPGKKEELRDGDVVAIAYSDKRGSYMSLTFKAS